MSLLSSSRQHLTISLPDLAQGTIRQVGYVIEQNWTQPLATGEVSGVIVVQVKRYLRDDAQPDGLGAELAEFNPRQPVRLLGDNNTLLLADTGEMVLQRTTESATAWQAAVAAKADALHPRLVVLQGDALELLREQPVAVAAEIRRHLVAAPAYHFAPKDASGQPILSP